MLRAETAKPSSTNTTLLRTAKSKCAERKGRRAREEEGAFEAWYGF
jgi:hypothetical protein